MRMIKLRAVDYFAGAVVSVFPVAIALFLADRRPWWQTSLWVVVFTTFGIRSLWQGMRARDAERAAAK